MMEFKYVSTRRDDVSQIYFKKTIETDFGFDIQFPYERGKERARFFQTFSLWRLDEKRVVQRNVFDFEFHLFFSLVRICIL